MAAMWARSRLTAIPPFWPATRASSDEARVAGQKGGVAVSRDRAHMAAIGREGGESRSGAARAARAASQGEQGGDREMQRVVSQERSGGAERPADGGSTRDGREEARS